MLSPSRSIISHAPSIAELQVSTPPSSRSDRSERVGRGYSAVFGVLTRAIVGGIEALKASHALDSAEP